MVAGHPEVGGDQGPAGHSRGRSAGQSGASDGRRVDAGDISTREVMRLSARSLLLLQAQQKLESVCGAMHQIGGPELVALKACRVICKAELCAQVTTAAGASAAGAAAAREAVAAADGRTRL